MLLFLLCFCTQATAQYTAQYFEYEDEEETIINGLTEEGRAQRSLTIPANVTVVRNSSFWGNIVLRELYVEGNPEFEQGTLKELVIGTEEVKGTLRLIDMGDAMSVENMKKLMLSYVEFKPENEKDVFTIIIEGYQGYPDSKIYWGGENDPINSVLTEEVRIVLPAAIVEDQVFGNAEVYGRFYHTTDLFTFCGKATFQDVGDGSNGLFYIPTELRPADKQVYIKRAWVLKAGRGVLVHKAENSASYVDVPRVNADAVSYVGMEEDYANNMLVGVTEPTFIGETSGDNNEYTNMILYQGTFRRTSGGTLGANRAYLRVLTSELRNIGSDANLSLTYDNDTPDAIQTVPDVQRSGKETWFSIDGRRLPGRPVQPGLYLHGGKAVVVQ